MNIQDTYDYLMQIRKMEFAILRKELRCQKLRSCLGVTSRGFNTDKVQTSSVDKMGDILCKVIELEHQIEELKRDKASLIIEICDHIEQLADDNEKTVLVEFYIGRLPMTQIAESIHYSIRRTYYFRQQGVLHLGQVLESRQTLHKTLC